MKDQLLSARVFFATIQEGRTRISTSDVYTRNLTQFDLQAKIRTLREVTEGDYLENAVVYVRGWSRDEVEYLSSVIEHTNRRLKELEIKVVLPEEIVLVKTTGWEEGGANGYTRGSSIFLNRHSLSRTLFQHELFHIISRHDERKRDDAYATLGFIRRGEFEYIDALRISNPDAPSLEHTTTVFHRGRSIDAAIIIRAARPYQGGGFFPYVTKRLLVQVMANAGTDHGAPILLDFGQVEGLYAQIGRNTTYNIHQEELCATHFSHLLEQTSGLPDEQLIRRLGAVLSAN